MMPTTVVEFAAASGCRQFAEHHGKLPGTYMIFSLHTLLLRTEESMSKVLGEEFRL